ncbi:MAG: DUF2812 domain-containing protein [Propionibacteriaceae bacterium]|jgi:hypothetical protein|nr:DUF2812 domain-containing protein [Propionibacteriaceae bacterium]
MTATQRVYKSFVDLDKQDDWLNSMSAEGWHLIRVGNFSYTFERGEPGAYIYRTQLLIDEKNPLASARSRAWREYLDTLADSGAEQVRIPRLDQSMGVVCLRRPAALGPFELFSDLQSRVEYYERHVRQLRAIGWFVAVLAVVCVVVGLVNVLGPHDVAAGWADLATGVVVAGAAIVWLTVAVRPWQAKIAELKREQTIHE